MAETSRGACSLSKTAKSKPAEPAMSVQAGSVELMKMPRGLVPSRMSSLMRVRAPAPRRSIVADVLSEGRVVRRRRAAFGPGSAAEGDEEHAVLEYVSRGVRWDDGGGADFVDDRRPFDL